MSHTQVWIHAICGVRTGGPLLDLSLQKELDIHIRERSIVHGFAVLATGGWLDHFHLLMSLSPVYSVAMQMNMIKDESARFINEKRTGAALFAWEAKFIALSVSGNRTRLVKRYINMQGTHHRKISFEEECASIMKMHSNV